MTDKQIQLRHLFQVYSGSTPESGKGFYWDGDIPWVTPEDLSSLENGNWLFDTKRKVTEEGFENAALNLVPAKSIVLSKRAPIGLLAILGIKACSNQGCFLLVPKIELNIEFYFYYLHALKSHLQILGRGSTFMELNTDDIKSFKLPTPDIAVQTKIAKYLNNELDQIDRLIAIRENQMNLLNEKRYSLIFQAVTKGLYTKRKMKSSNLDWLDEVPTDWEILQLKFICDKIETGGTPSADWINYESENLVNWYTPADFNENIRLSEAKRPLAMEALRAEGFKLYPKNAILVVGIGATLGKIGLISQEAFSNQQINALLVKNNMFSDYFAYQLLVMTDYLRASANASTLAILNQQKMGSLYVVKPSYEEQEEIVTYINHQVEKIDHLKTITAKSIELLKERKEALINAAVTGQVEIN